MTSEFNGLVSPSHSVVLVIDVQDDACHPQGIYGRTGRDISLRQKAAHNTVEFIKEALETYSRGYGYATLRTNVDESFLEPGTIPRPGVNYFDDSDWKWAVTGRKEAREQVGKLLKSR